MALYIVNFNCLTKQQTNKQLWQILFFCYTVIHMLNGVKWRFDLRAPYNKQRRKYMIRTDLIELVVMFYSYMYICINYYDLVIFRI